MFVRRTSWDGGRFFIWSLRGWKLHCKSQIKRNMMLTVMPWIVLCWEDYSLTWWLDGGHCVFSNKLHLVHWRWFYDLVYTFQMIKSFLEFFEPLRAVLVVLSKIISKDHQKHVNIVCTGQVYQLRPAQDENKSLCTIVCSMNNSNDLEQWYWQCKIQSFVRGKYCGIDAINQCG